MSAIPPAETILALIDLVDDSSGRVAGRPDSYCQWIITRDRQGLKWDGGEKFYHYDEWLQWIMDNILSPAGIEPSGTVQYQGEEIGDCGVLTIEGGKAVKKQLALVSDDLVELIRFRDFALQSRWGHELAEAWKRQRK